MNSVQGFEGVIEFVAVAEQKGFSNAAKHLGCSTSHVSRQVSRLERKLGVALIARTTRSIKLTQVGEAYYLKCRDLVYGLMQANEEVGSDQFQLSGTLKVSAAGTFAETFAAKALIDFAKQHPQLDLHMSFDSRLVNFIDEGFDFAIRVGKLKDSGLVARKLVHRSLMAAASPEYLARKGTPTHYEHLKSHDCIINNDIWNFEENNTHQSLRINGRFQSNNANVLVDACVAGLGIAYLPKSNFHAHIQSGKLVPVLAPFWYTDVNSWIVYQNRLFLPSRARLAIEYLLDYFDGWTE